MTTDIWVATIVRVVSADTGWQSVKDRRIIDVDMLGPGAVQVVAWTIVDRVTEIE